jgi:hypothetical protein
VVYRKFDTRKATAASSQHLLCQTKKELVSIN